VLGQLGRYGDVGGVSLAGLPAALLPLPGMDPVSGASYAVVVPGAP
jgi:hypothetical protein